MAIRTAPKRKKKRPTPRRHALPASQQTAKWENKVWNNHENGPRHGGTGTYRVPIHASLDSWRQRQAGCQARYENGICRGICVGQAAIDAARKLTALIHDMTDTLAIDACTRPSSQSYDGRPGISTAWCLPAWCGARKLPSAVARSIPATPQAVFPVMALDRAGEYRYGRRPAMPRAAGPYSAPRDAPQGPGHVPLPSHITRSQPLSTSAQAPS